MNEQHYSGKPLAYLDQNILDSFIKKEKEQEVFIDGFKQRFQVVYSDITLQEIHLSGLADFEYTQSFLKILQRLDAMYISIRLDQNWKPINQIEGSSKSPFHHYQLFLENRKYDSLLKKFKMSSFALYGGIEDYNKLADDQINHQYDLLIDLEDQLNKLKETKTEDVIILKFIEQKELEFENLKKQMLIFKKDVHFSSETLKEANSEMDAHIAFRKALGINIDKIEEITFPNVIEKIWQSIQMKNDSLKKMNFEDFCQINYDPTDNDRNLTDFEKIHSIYFILNFIGYKPEKKVKNERKFIASDRDISHVAYASFCNYFITNDERLLNKSKAIYEYLNINTHATDIPLFK